MYFYPIVHVIKEYLSKLVMKHRDTSVCVCVYMCSKGILPIQLDHIKSDLLFFFCCVW